MGFRDLISYSKGFKYVLCNYLGPTELVKHEGLWCWMAGTTLYSEKMEIFTIKFTKRQYSNKQAFITFFVRHGTQILTTLNSMALS